MHIYENSVTLQTSRNKISVNMEKLTQQEEHIMQAIWQIGMGAVRDIMDKIPDNKSPYTTIASGNIKQVLCQALSIIILKIRTKIWFRFLPKTKKYLQKI